MRPLRFGLIGCGFWGRVQLAGWGEHASVARCVAVCDADPGRADALAAEFGVASAHADAARMLDEESLDFVDIVTPVQTHAALVALACSKGTASICQKPLADKLGAARAMVAGCEMAGVPLLVHENFRWQAPIRAVRDVLDSGEIGDAFRATIDFISGFNVFANQPSLKQESHFIIADLGSHTLDVARFLFGEMDTVVCRAGRVHDDIQGEDVATAMLGAQSGATVLVRMAYAGNAVERECFPQTLMFVEGDRGTLELRPGYELRITTADGTRTLTAPPPSYPWVDQRYAVVQSSVVPCQADLLRGLRGRRAETTGRDNLKTVELVWAAYESAARGDSVRLRNH